MSNNQSESKKNGIEEYTEWYFRELKDAGYIIDYSRETYPIELVPKSVMKRYDFSAKSKIKVQDFTLLNSDDYKFDYMIIWDESARDIFFTEIDREAIIKIGTPFFAYKTDEGKIISLCDVKPPPAAKQHGNNTTGYTFPTKQKVLWHVHNIFINRTIPIPMASNGVVKSGNNLALFTKTFCPRRYTFTDGGGKPRKINYKIKSLVEYVRDQKTLLQEVNQRLSVQTLL